ncbi:acetate--CoA ligase family protein [Candidatus Fermentibacteria bacterium]|nr:acetate--CoA ligase family protein [Candidatus Fermentibacteria bacterium]
MNDHTQILAECLDRGARVLLEQEAYRLLEMEGLPVPATRLVCGAEDVTAGMLKGIPGERVILKLASRAITHKTDVGGIKIVAKETSEVARAVGGIIKTVTDRHGSGVIDGVMIAELVDFSPTFGHELLAGFRLDAAFGPVVSLGLGGIHTEFFHEHLKPASSLRSCSALAVRMEHLLKGSALERPLLGQLRGQRKAPISQDTLRSFMETLAAMARDSYAACPGEPRLAEMEINPVVVDSRGRLVVLDAVARVERAPEALPGRPLRKITKLLRPTSALVAGASTKGMNSGRIILRNLLEGGGVPKERIYGLHPAATEIDGVRCFARLSDLPERVDMAVIAIPAAGGADRVVCDLVEHEAVHSITLIPGGFAETEGGKEREQRLRDALAASHAKPDGGVILNGGNCLGIVSNPGGYNTFFLPKYKLPFTPAKGDNLAAISQSGAYLVTQASTFDGVINPRYSISVGNQVDLTVGDYLLYLVEEEGLEVFSVYVEGFQPGDGLQFLNSTRHATAAGKAVLLYKAGRSPEGARAASSHTASMVGDYDTAAALAAQAGAVVCDTLDQYQDLTLAFSLLWSRPPAGNKVGVISNAGFEATASADRLGSLRLADLLPETLENLTKALPEDVIDAHNPLDVTPVTNTEGFARCVDLMLDDPTVDCVVVSPVPPTPALNNLPPSEMHRENVYDPASLPSRLIDLFKKTQKPMVFCVDSGPLYDPMVRMLLEAGAPCYRHIDRAMAALSSFVAVRSREVRK